MQARGGVRAGSRYHRSSRGVRIPPRPGNRSHQGGASEEDCKKKRKGEDRTGPDGRGGEGRGGEKGLILQAAEIHQELVLISPLYLPFPKSHNARPMAGPDQSGRLCHHCLVANDSLATPSGVNLRHASGPGSWKVP